MVCLSALAGCGTTTQPIHAMQQMPRTKHESQTIAQLGLPPSSPPSLRLIRAATGNPFSVQAYVSHWIVPRADMAPTEPVPWPTSLTSGMQDGLQSISFDTKTPPSRVELRAYARLLPNGVPDGSAAAPFVLCDSQMQSSTPCTLKTIFSYSRSFRYVVVFASWHLTEQAVRELKVSSSRRDLTAAWLI